jgi:3'-phosphoadenosine 5'-phosphosulfate sulfotransferase (PAPS reductase)/FAD synthetase
MTGSANPYLIEGPALVSFSGGRSSALMLWSIVQAHGGTLPEDVVVAFANTGKEREETLRFVHECETRWNVRVRWLEYRDRYGPQADRFEEVGYNSASRNGEPFAELIRDKGYTPNSQMRFCSYELKVARLRDFAQVVLGWEWWSNVIGLRRDEPMRLLRVLERNDKGDMPYRTVCPLASAEVGVRDVKAFWAAQPFDLGLRSYEGNCDLCFLKGRGNLRTIIREQPGVAGWWKAQEVVGKGQFSSRFSMAELEAEVEAQPSLFDPSEDGEDYDAECGLACMEPVDD